MAKGMTDQANKNRDFITALKGQLLRGEITPDEAKEKAKPVIAAMNERAKEIAKEHGMRFKPISFTNLMR